MTIKCVVWDLDNTLWNGILLEDERVTARPEVIDTIRALDERGILHSVASRNEPEVAMAKLRELGIAEYFLHPQIHWGAKSGSVREIAAALNIGIDTFAFVDDQPFERDEVRSQHPRLRCFDALDAGELPAMPEFQPRFVTEDSRERRRLYQADARRKEAEREHVGTSESFLASLRMSFRVERATEDDLQRAEELTVRTNQLNATGYTYSYDELREFCRSDRHELLVASLEDRYGSYGTIGLVLMERDVDAWTIKLLLMSCRVASRGVGAVLLHNLVRKAKAAGVRLFAEFVPTDRNRTMYVTYRFAGFRESGERSGVRILVNDYSRIHDDPPYMAVTTANLAPQPA